MGTNTLSLILFSVAEPRLTLLIGSCTIWFFCIPIFLVSWAFNSYCPFISWNRWFCCGTYLWNGICCSQLNCKSILLLFHFRFVSSCWLWFKDAGYYGKGIYFTPDGLYTLPYIAPSRNPALILSWVTPGNVYPCTGKLRPCPPTFPSHIFCGSSPLAIFLNFLLEYHLDPAVTLIGTAVKAGYGSHFVVTNKKGFPVTQPKTAGTFMEFVIPQEAQITPAYIINLDKTAMMSVSLLSTPSQQSVGRYHFCHLYCIDWLRLLPNGNDKHLVIMTTMNFTILLQIFLQMYPRSTPTQALYKLLLNMFKLSSTLKFPQTMTLCNLKF